jgi:hypothetical protein
MNDLWGWGSPTVPRKDVRSPFRRKGSRQVKRGLPQADKQRRTIDISTVPFSGIFWLISLIVSPLSDNHNLLELYLWVHLLGPRPGDTLLWTPLQASHL